MPRVRTEEQLQLALNAPPRPERKDAGGDSACGDNDSKARWRTLQCDWVASWRGRLLEADASAEAWRQWWKQSKSQYKALLLVAASNKENSNAVVASNTVATGAPPSKVAAVRLAGLEYVTTAWLQRRAPEVKSLSASAGVSADGSKCITLKALVAGEEREAVVDYSTDGLGEYYDGQRENVNRKREETALLQVVSS